MKKILLAIGMVVILAVQAQGNNSEVLNDMANRVGVFGTLGYSAYIMGNEYKYIYNLLAGNQELSVDSFNGGITGGLGLTYGLSNLCQIGLEFEDLGGETNAAMKPENYVTVSLPLSEFGAFVKILWPAETWWSYSFGLGVYDLWIDNAAGKYTFSDGTAAAPVFSGSTPAVKLWVGGEHFFSRHISLGADIGYRFAHINDVIDKNGGTWVSSDGSKLNLNCGGPYVRVTLQYYF